MTDDNHRIFCPFCQAYFVGVTYRQHRAEDVEMGIKRKPKVVTNYVAKRGRNLR